jgi:hypothetical protein
MDTNIYNKFDAVQPNLPIVFSDGTTGEIVARFSLISQYNIYERCKY